MKIKLAGYTITLTIRKTLQNKDRPDLRQAVKLFFERKGDFDLYTGSEAYYYQQAIQKIVGVTKPYANNPRLYQQAQKIAETTIIEGLNKDLSPRSCSIKINL